MHELYDQTSQNASITKETLDPITYSSKTTKIPMKFHGNFAKLVGHGSNQSYIRWAIFFDFPSSGVRTYDFPSIKSPISS